MANSFHKPKFFVNKEGVIHSGNAENVDILISKGLVKEVAEPNRSPNGLLEVAEPAEPRRRRKKNDANTVDSSTESEAETSEAED